MFKEAEENVLLMKKWLEDLNKEIETLTQKKNRNSKTKRLKT